MQRNKVSILRAAAAILVAVAAAFWYQYFANSRAETSTELSTIGSHLVPGWFDHLLKLKNDKPISQERLITLLDSDVTTEQRLIIVMCSLVLYNDNNSYQAAVRFLLSPEIPEERTESFLRAKLFVLEMLGTCDGVKDITFLQRLAKADTDLLGELDYISRPETTVEINRLHYNLRKRALSALVIMNNIEAQAIGTSVIQEWKDAYQTCRASGADHGGCQGTATHAYAFAALEAECLRDLYQRLGRNAYLERSEDWSRNERACYTSNFSDLGL